MRTPLLVKRSQAARAQNAIQKSFPAPLGGWNARDPLADMDPLDAVILDNWMPQTSYCEMRGGSSEHATGLTGIGKTLAVYNSLTGVNTMWALTATGTYNVSSAGAVGASVAARTNGKHQWVMFGDGTKNWLILANGVDKPLYYDGTTWTAVDAVSSPALTGITSTDVISVNIFKNRLFLILKDQLAFHYLPAAVAGGAVSKFDLSGQCKRGGFLMAMATWTRDAGDGMDDVAVFITSKGEVIVYQGTNPASVADWVKVGSFFLGEPIGRRCVTQYGGEVIVLTQNGAYPLTAGLLSASMSYKDALSFKIERVFTGAARTYGSLFGWESTVYPEQNALLVNIPNAEDGVHDQYVMNTITKSWCRFTGWDAETFVVFNKELYFAKGTTIYKAWSGRSDLGSNIEAVGKQAFQYFGRRGMVKKFKLFRPILAANGSVNYLIGLDVDFSDRELIGAATSSVASGSLWDVALWDVGLWAEALTISKRWSAPTSWEGYAVAGKIKISTNSLEVQWASNDIIFEPGGVYS